MIYHGYLFGAFNSITDEEYGSSSFFTDDKISKQVYGKGCITQSKESDFKNTRIMWTSPNISDVVVHLQYVVTFDHASSLITLIVDGINSNTSSIVINKNILHSHINDNTNHTMSMSIADVIIIVILVFLLIIISVVFSLSFIKIIRVNNS